MKKLILLSSLILAGCAYDPSVYTHTHTRAGGMEKSGVGVAYGIGASYNKPQGNGRELTQDELDYIKANQVDFGAVQKANEEANMAIYEREVAGLKEGAQLSCEDLAALGYQVLVNKAWESGDWASVKSYNTKGVISRCHANRGK